MTKPKIMIGVAILACGLSFAVFLLRQPRGAGPARPHVYDLTDGNFDRIVEDPGPVRIDMPNSISISGRPASINFGETAVGRGFIYYCPGQRFSDAYQLALAYCKQYGIDPKRIVDWHDQGKGQPRFPHAGADNGNCPGVQAGVDVWDLLDDPYAFVVEVSFDWPKAFSESDKKIQGVATPSN
jgi:hypothetical protein